jgi:hypothetical protein
MRLVTYVPQPNPPQIGQHAMERRHSIVTLMSLPSCNKSCSETKPDEIWPAMTGKTVYTRGGDRT